MHSHSPAWLLIDPLARDAMVAGVAVGLTCALLSVLVVLRRMAFIGQGVAHCGFAGVGLATFLGITAGAAQDAILAAACVLAAIGIGVMSRRGRLETDTAIGVVVVVAMALGVVLTELSVSLRSQALRWYIDLTGTLESPPPSFEQVLFGSLLGVGQREMWTAVIACGVVLLVLALGFRYLVSFTFDPAAARVAGVPTGAVYYLLLVLLAAVIVVSIRLVGVVLASALLVIPGATALLLTRRLFATFALAGAVGVLGTTGGVLLSWELGRFSTGPVIVALLALLFAAAWGVRKSRGG
ncbi:MAG: metal ABC transporter permease [Phycisphaeraceae bacterium]